jgi:hypothetical protein
MKFQLVFEVNRIFNLSFAVQNESEKNDKFSIAAGAMSMKRYSNHVIFYSWIHNTRNISNLCSFATDECLSKQLIGLIALICKRCFESGKHADGVSLECQSQNMGHACKIVKRKLIRNID